MIVAAAALWTELLFVRGLIRVRTGVGPRAAERLSRALERLRPRGAVILGFCGATHAYLVPGTIVLATSVRHDGEELGVTPELVARAREKLPDAELGALTTSDGIADPATKARLSLDSVAADMESFHLARELRARGIPFLVVRCVLDALWEDLSRAPKARWAARALACARKLGTATEVLASVVAGGEG